MNMHEAKTTLSKLVEEVQSGDDVVIARAGKPVARLIPYVERRQPRVPGRWKGKVWMAPNFDDDDDAEMVALFEDGPVFPE